MREAPRRAGGAAGAAAGRAASGLSRAEPRWAGRLRLRAESSGGDGSRAEPRLRGGARPFPAAEQEDAGRSGALSDGRSPVQVDQLPGGLAASVVCLRQWDIVIL